MKRIQCRIKFLGLFLTVTTQWDIYPQDMTDKEWKQWYRKNWVQPWARYLCTYKLIKE